MAKVRPFGHESPSVDTSMVLKVVAVLFGAVVIALIVLYFTMTHSDRFLGNHAEVVQRTDVVPPPPRLQPHPDTDLSRLRREKRDKLTTYAWEGSAHDVARIPIKRAMQLYVQQQAASRHVPRHEDSKP